MTRKQMFIFAALVPLIVIFLDQLTKNMVLQFFAGRYGSPMDVCSDPRFYGILHEVSKPFDLTLSCNRGVSFGMLGSDSQVTRWGLTSFAVIVSAILVYAIKTSKDRLTALSFGMIIGGSLGNVIDRVRFGAVVDFLDFNGIHFPGIFNIADSFITIGVIGMLIAAFLYKDEESDAG